MTKHELTEMKRRAQFILRVATTKTWSEKDETRLLAQAALKAAARIEEFERQLARAKGE